MCPFSTDDVRFKGLAAPSNLSMNQTLEGHRGESLAKPGGDKTRGKPLKNKFPSAQISHDVMRDEGKESRD